MSDLTPYEEITIAALTGDWGVVGRIQSCLRDSGPPTIEQIAEQGFRKGSYLHRCPDCNRQFLASKRSRRCHACAANQHYGGG